MQYFSSTDARTNISKAIMIAQREPVFIQKQGKDVAVIISTDDYNKITQDNIDDFLIFCRLVGTRAKKLGLTQAKLNKLLKSSK